MGGATIFSFFQLKMQKKRCVYCTIYCTIKELRNSASLKLMPFVKCRWIKVEDELGSDELVFECGGDVPTL